MGSSDYYDYGYGMGEAVAAFIGVFLILFLLIGVVFLGLYILRSIGIMTIARNRGLQNPWLIWVPVAGAYTIGAIADDIQAREGSRTIFRWLLLGGNLISIVISFIAGVASTGSLASVVEYFEYNSYYGDPFPVMGPAMLFANLFGGVGSLVSFGIFVVTIIALHYIYKCYKPESSTAYTVLSVIFPFMQSIFPFALRNRQPNWLNPPYYGGPGGYPPAGEPWQAPPQDNQPGGFQYGQQPPQQGYQPPYQGYQPPQQSDQPPQQGYGAPPANGYPGAGQVAEQNPNGDDLNQ